MNFGTNLTAARKAKGLSQEELAERLLVSRQTIYKWETGVTYPDIDRLCDIAKCLEVSTAYLLGEWEAPPCAEPNAAPEEAKNSICTVDKAETVRHYKRFARMIGACTLLILASVGALVLLNGFSVSWVEALAVIQLLCCISVAVVGYVVAGLHHEAFEKQAGRCSIFEKEEQQKEQHGFVFKIVAGLVLIFAGVIFVVIAGFSERELLAYIAVAALLALIGVAVYLFITAGIMHDLYMGEESPGRHHEKEKEPAEAACGIIMMLATAAFLVMGFVWDLWHPAWVVFPVGGLLCGCVSVIFGNGEKGE